MKNVLFITWDGPQTSYMEGLFMPIYSEVQAKSEYQFHVVQFTWGNHERIAITSKKARELGVLYTAKKISRKPIATLGSMLTLYKGIKYLKKYIHKNNIDVVMPRSTMPSIMVNRIKELSAKLLFDADGMAIEERVDFSGLSKTSKQYRFFKKEENKMLAAADGVITRSQKAVAIHQKTLRNKDSEKFSVVFNGRNTNFFKPSELHRNQIRTELNVSHNAKLFIYCGSLGPQYGWEEMMAIFEGFHSQHNDAKFLLLTGNISFATDRIPEHLASVILVKQVPFEGVPNHLAAADIAFAIRQPKPSMQAIAPIKLGEYLLMGIPTIASAGIGDSETLVKQIPNCHLFHHDSKEAITNAVQFIEDLKEVDHATIRNFGIDYFSIEKSAESYIEALDKLFTDHTKQQ
jgi:glycosyltransferase involved in cell wall biosynthesis